MRNFSGLIIGIIVMILSGINFSCKSDNDTLKLAVSPSTIEFGAEGGTKTIEVDTKSSWIVSNSPDWLTESVKSHEGYGKFALTATANETNVSRSATISVTADDITKKIEVSQKSLSDTVPEFTYNIPPDSSEMRNLTSVELTRLMGVGWNIGNSLDAVGGETNWGNPKVTQKLIDSVKIAGFNTIRIPVAWSKFSDDATYTIEQSWLNRVEEVVNYVLNNNMYAIVNIHWDGGWMQPTYEDEDYVNTRLAVMWDQIATQFRDYNDHLLFAGTNEVMVDGDYSKPTKEYYTVQNGFNQTFVTTVRATGGRNAYRHLVVQGFNTNIEYTVNYFIVPQDVTPNRLMVEVHYYDPYEFTLKEDGGATQWGKIAADPGKTAGWGNEDYVDNKFLQIKSNFIDKGYGVILGEYGVIARTSVEGHEEYRRYYLEYITKSLMDHGLVPIYWDNGNTGNYGFGIFNRSTGEKAYPDLISAIVSASK